MCVRRGGRPCVQRVGRQHRGVLGGGGGRAVELACLPATHAAPACRSPWSASTRCSRAPSTPCTGSGAGCPALPGGQVAHLATPLPHSYTARWVASPLTPPHTPVHPLVPPQRVRAADCQGGAQRDVAHAAGPARGAALPPQGPPARPHAAAGVRGARGGPAPGALHGSSQLPVHAPRPLPRPSHLC